MTDQELLVNICESEERYRFDSFKNEDALTLGLQILQETKNFADTAAVEIVINGLVVFRYVPYPRGGFESLWLQAKRNTVEMMGKSTLRMAVEMRINQIPKDPPSYMPGAIVRGGGGFPIRLTTGLLIGSIATSGLTDVEDHEVIIKALKRFFSEKS